jgi:hypothetical protein
VKIKYRWKEFHQFRRKSGNLSPAKKTHIYLLYLRLLLHIYNMVLITYYLQLYMNMFGQQVVYIQALSFWLIILIVGV